MGTVHKAPAAPPTGERSARITHAPALDAPVFLEQVATVAAAAGVPVYIVGGYVRDLLLQRVRPDGQVADVDLLALGSGVDFARRLAGALRLPKPVVFPRFDTARLVFRNAHVEIVGTGLHAPDMPAPGPSHLDERLRRDLVRRDFTVNAMALPVATPEAAHVIDLYDGEQDLRDKFLRTPLDPVTTLTEDPIRLLRAVRLSAELGFAIESGTYAAVCAECARLDGVSQERITGEFMKIMALPQPSKGLALLKESGLLAVFLRDVDQLIGVETIDGKGHKDVFWHTLQVVDNVARVSENVALRFAALMHDIAKPRTKRFEPGTGWTFHGHEEVGARMAKGIARRLRLPRAFAAYTQKIVRFHLRPIHLADEGVTDSPVRRLVVGMGDDLDDLMILCRADITSKNPWRVRNHLQNFDDVCRRIVEVREKDALRSFQSPVTGAEIMARCGIPPGPAVGRLKKRIEDAILSGEIPNEHDAAFAYFLRIKDTVLAASPAPR